MNRCAARRPQWRRLKLFIVALLGFCAAPTFAQSQSSTSDPPFVVQEDGYLVYPGSVVAIPSTKVGTTTEPVRFTLVNRLESAVQLDRDAPVEVDGVDRTDYRVTQQPARTLDPGGQTSFSLRFDPTSLGERDAAISIRFGSDGSSSYVFYVVANGLSSGSLLLP